MNDCLLFSLSLLGAGAGRQDLSPRRWRYTRIHYQRRVVRGGGESISIFQCVAPDDFDDAPGSKMVVCRNVANHRLGRAQYRVTTIERPGAIRQFVAPPPETGGKTIGNMTTLCVELALR